MVDGIQAAQSLRALPGLSDPGLCLKFVWEAYKKHGASASGWYSTALDGWIGSPGKHPGDRHPPAGVPVWWGSKKDPNFTGTNKDAGDVVISLGGDQVVATDFPSNLQVGVTTIDGRENQIARHYLGWTETILGAPIEGIAGPRPKEKKMAYSLVPISSSDEIHVVSLVTGIRAHIKNPVHLKLLNRVQKNEFDDEMRLRELDIVRGYLTAINPPPAVEIDAQALADALAAINVESDPVAVNEQVNDAITSNSRVPEGQGDGGLNNRL